MSDNVHTQVGKAVSNEDVLNIALIVDACGTRCPVPLLRAKQALKKLAGGEYLQVLATDPSAKADFDAMLRHLPHSLVSYVSGEGKQADEFIILKG